MALLARKYSSHVTGDTSCILFVSSLPPRYFFVLFCCGVVGVIMYLCIWHVDVQSSAVSMLTMWTINRKAACCVQCDKRVFIRAFFMWSVQTVHKIIVPWHPFFCWAVVCFYINACSSCYCIVNWEENTAFESSTVPMFHWRSTT